MEREIIKQQLLDWDPNELFFRDYIEKTRAGEPVDTLLNSAVPAEWKDWMTDPSSIDPDKTEKDFFREGRNVSLTKHPRFFPYFEHRHTFFELIYVLTGQCAETIQGSRITLKQGDLFVLAPSIMHGIEVMDDSVVINILIRHSTFMDMFLHTVRDKSELALFFLGSLYEKDKIPYLLYHTGSDILIRDYILDMVQEQTQEDEYSDKIMCALLTIMLQQLIRQYTETMESPGRQKEHTEYQDSMLAYIMEHYRTITLSELAGAFHFSVPYCSRMIQEISGSSFSELVTGLKLQQGENLLSHTQMNVTDISEQIGYKNPETFIRAFRRCYKMSPGQYRKSVLIGTKSL